MNGRNFVNGVPEFCAPKADIPKKQIKPSALWQKGCRIYISEKRRKLNYEKELYCPRKQTYHNKYG